MQCGLLGNWQDNLFTMKDPKQEPYPDDFDGIRNKISDLVDEGRANKKDLDDYKFRPRAWTWAYWEKHTAKLSILLFILSVTSGVTWCVYGLILDSHMNSSIHPLDEKVNGIKADIQGLTATVGALQTQVAAMRYSALPPGN